MTFTYNGASLSQIIKNFEVTEDGKYIVIHYLDGHYNVTSFSEDEIKELIGMQQRQALERLENLDTSVLENNGFVTACGYVITFCGLYLIYQILTDYKFGYVLALYSIYRALKMTCDDILTNEDKLEELEKYKIYLEHLEQLDICDDFSLYDGVEMTTEHFNINTLDEYSLDEVKKIMLNLEKWVNKSQTESFQMTKKLPETLTNRIDNVLL